MSFALSFADSLRAWAGELDQIERVLLPEAIAKALTWTAYDLRDENREHMATVFDRPTRFTLGSLQATPATEADPVASVGFKDQIGQRRHYLWPQVEGGPRPHKQFEKLLIARGIMHPSEFAVPGRRAPLDAAGNIRPSLIVQILSQFGAQSDRYANETKRSRKRAGSGRVRYFVPGPGKWERLPRGIWSEATRNSAPIPIILFVRQPTYQVRYRFAEFNTARAEALFPSRFDRALRSVVERSIRA